MSILICGINDLKKGTADMANLFTKEQQEALRVNPYTLSVTERQIRFTALFKRLLLAEIAKPGVTQNQAFRNLGYDPDVLGKSRVTSTVKNIRVQAASPQGLHDPGFSSKRLAREDLSRQRAEVAIKKLQRELLRTQQELSFVKKILQLPLEDDGTP